MRTPCTAHANLVLQEQSDSDFVYILDSNRIDMEYMLPTRSGFCLDIQLLRRLLAGIVFGVTNNE